VSCRKNEVLQGCGLQKIGDGVRGLQPDGTAIKALEGEGLQRRACRPQSRHQLAHILSHVWVGFVMFVADEGESDRLEQWIHEMEDGTNLVFVESKVELEFL
jgi:hypothetical protein